MAKKSMIAREVKRKKLVKNLMQQMIQWKDWKYIERFKDFQETLLQTELEIDVGPLVNQEVFIEILVYVEIN